MTTAFKKLKEKFLWGAYEKDGNLVSTTRRKGKLESTKIISTRKATYERKHRIAGALLKMSHPGKVQYPNPLPWEQMTVKFAQGDVESSNRSVHNIPNRVLRELTCKSLSATFSTYSKPVP